MRFWLRVVIVIVMLGVSSCSAQAADFATSIVSTYTVLSSQQVEVNQLLSVTNLNDARYPTGYTFVIPSEHISNLTIIDSFGTVIHPDIITLASGTKINLKFSTPIVGINKTQTYTITYQDRDSWVGSSQNIELAIPPLNLTDTNLSATTKAILPVTTCQPPASYPSPSDTTTEGILTTLTYTHLSPQQSIFIRCAGKRFVTVNLKYFLTNTNMTPIETQVTLPPDTAYQRLWFTSIDPQPIDLSSDADGNVIATYHLEPKQAIHISVSANAVIYGNANPDFSLKDPDKLYLEPTPLWPSHDPEIKKLANSLGSTAAIYRYLMLETTFVPSPDNRRLGGKTIITHSKTFSGEDFVDSFITLNRAIGVRSRRLVGFAESNNLKLRPLTSLSNTLHTWAEYYDATKNQWVAVDPTWEKTSLISYDPIPDVNRIVLAINGADDTNPYPAGYYQSPDSNGPDISMTDTDPFTFPPPDIHATLIVPVLNQLHLNPHVNLVLTNKSYSSLYHQSFKVMVNHQTIKQFTLDRLPTQNQVIIPITLPKKHDSLTLETNQTIIPITITGTSDFSPFAVAGVVAGIAGLLAVITGRLLVSRRR